MYTADDIKEIETNLEATVHFLSEKIGPRSYHDLQQLERAAEYIEDKIRSYGCEVEKQTFNYTGTTRYLVRQALMTMRAELQACSSS
ncbi:MAG: hypothetical protein NT055_01850 [Nitrospirae bacterium]|nr:hypothetical protein [Nitrospirota bacterium]